jgi:regulator of nucleoside diphosphate kinase
MKRRAATTFDAGRDDPADPASAASRHAFSCEEIPMNRVIIPADDLHALRQLGCDRLAGELDRADVVPRADVRGDVVTMHTRVRYLDETAGERREVTLVYPHESDVANGRVSVLAPVGSALLGLSEGQAIDWEFPDGRPRRLRVESVIRN